MPRNHLNLASIALITLLAGCGGGGGGGGGGGSPPPPPVDATPNTFTIPERSDTPLSGTATSTDIVITGINAAAAISITGGEYSIDGGAFTSASGTVNNNQHVTVRVSSSAQFSTTSSAVLTVGGVSATFTATTVAEDKTPDAFQFAAIQNAPRSTAVTSASVAIIGINSAASISVADGEYSIEGGGFTNAAGTVTNNQHVVVRLTTSNQFSTASSAKLTVGGVEGTFTVTTLAADTVPDAFQFAGKTGVARDSWVASNAVTITGINTSSPVSIENGEYSVAGGAFTSAAGTIEPDQALVVRVRSSAVYSKSARTRVTVGTVAAEFEVAAELPTLTPNDVDFDGSNVVYLLDSANRLVYRWSIDTARYLDPFVLDASGSAPTIMAYSAAHQRLYLGYGNGAIRYLDCSVSMPVETTFTTLPAAISSLGDAGKFLVAQANAGYDSGYVLNSSGATVDHGGYYYGYSRETAWDPVSARIYYFRDGISPNDLHYDEIDQSTGLVGAQNETPYHGAYSIIGPIRVSANGAYVQLGSGDIYNRDQLTWAGSLAAQIADARWFANGSLVTLQTSGNQTTLRRLGASNLAILEQRTFTGQALRVAGTDQKMAVLVMDGGKPRFYTYVPSDDSDNDGVPNTQDAFPLDAAASVDSDQDGRPDAWNAGRTQADSTTGLALDAFPQDSACWLSSHATAGGTCDYGATLPNYLPDQIVQQGDVVYLLSIANRRVYRWSISTGKYLNPYVVGTSQGFTTSAPNIMAVSPAHQRLYLGYDSGAIRYIDLASTSPAELPFANVAMGVRGLASVGSFVLAQDSSGAWATHYVINAAGVITDQAEWNYYSREYAWDPNTSRVYFFRDDTSPNDLHYEVIDQSSGQISGAGETPYHGDYGIAPPIRVTANGQYILIGSGNLFSKDGLTWAGAVGAGMTDARWFANGQLVTLSTANNQAVLRRQAGANFATVEQLLYTGQALRVVGTDAKMALVLFNANTVQFRTYVPDDDSDDDGVLNTADAFPLDPAASVDTDGDGYPDAWNAGRSQADSTTGLTLDVFPQDAACWLSSHGSGGVCNYGATIPNYIPDKVEQQGDIIYLLSSANRRVYRWSISGQKYLNPYVVGLDQGLSSLAPTTMAVSAAHQRLYLGYSNGAVRYVATSGATTLLPFATLSTGVSYLSSAGNFVLATTPGYDSGYILDNAGAIKDHGGYYYGYSRETEYDPNTHRVYFFRDGLSPNDLHFDEIDQVTGQVVTSGETPYHGDYPFGGVIRVTPDGQSVLVGTGDLYAGTGLTHTGALGSQITDARWLASGALVALTTANHQTQITRLNGTGFSVLEQRSFAGDALRVLGSDASMVLLLINNGTVQFVTYVPNDDSDGDGVTNVQDAFPLDAAASVDTDHDGYPDAWNAGKSQADSTTGLVLDAYAQNAGCWLSAHGSGGVCNPGSTVPNYIPDQVVQQGNVIYLLSSANRRVYRWSISGAAYLSPYVVGRNQGLSTESPVEMAYSASHQRLYLGYTSGTLRYIDVNASNPLESAFVTMPAGITGLSSAGNFLVAHVGGYYPNAGSHVLDSSGVTRDQSTTSYYNVNETVWDAVRSRLYYVSAGNGAVSYDVIDQTTGEVTATGTSTYSVNSSPLQPPGRVSVNGNHMLLGNGDFYALANLTWEGSLGSAMTDARWFADGSLVTLAPNGNQTTLKHLGSSTLALLEQKSYAGQPLRVVGSDAAMTVLVINNNTVQFHSYAPSTDTDGDGVLNTSDAFPLDVAASVDSDGDGRPDSWNAGKTQSDSTSGLQLDAFPTESECWLSAHGSGGVCNYAATLPNYVPDKIDQRGDVVYLLSVANRRIYRWSIASGTYLKPYTVGLNPGFGMLPPTTMAYSSGHQRLYVGYGNGIIRYFDVNAANPVQTAFNEMSPSIYSLSDAGNYLLVQTNGGYGSGFVVDGSGVSTAHGGYYYGYSRETAWDPNYSRAYYFRDGISPNDMHFDVIDQANGTISSTGETPYHGEFSFQGVIRVSPDGSQILTGSGDIFARNGLTRIASLGKAVTDARWKDNLLVDVDSTDLVELRDANSRAVLQSYQYLGQPLRVVFGTSEGYLVHVMNNTTQFIRLPFYDSDSDGIPRWWEQLYAGMNDASAADATGDLDGDGVNNLVEYQNRSNPLMGDTDSDGLGDAAEIGTWHTNPSLRDTDGDGLGDQAEVVTYGTDPLDADSDNDGYSDLDEVLYGGNPNDVSVLPQPMYNYSQTFEGTPNMWAWGTPSMQSGGPWTVVSSAAHAGTASFKSGTTGPSQSSAVKFRGFFRPGMLTFWAKVDIGYCCNRLYVSVDGAPIYNLGGSTQWNSFTLPLTLGVHEIEWRFETYSTVGGPTDSAWIDDVVFVGQ